MPSRKRIPSWENDLMRDTEIYSAPKKYLKESKKLKLYSIYVACLCDIMDAKLFSYEENAENRVWTDAKGEEYQFIVKNDVWDVVSK